MQSISNVLLNARTNQKELFTREFLMELDKSGKVHLSFSHFPNTAKKPGNLDRSSFVESECGSTNTNHSGATWPNKEGAKYENSKSTRPDICPPLNNIFPGLISSQTNLKGPQSLVS